MTHFAWLALAIILVMAGYVWVCLATSRWPITAVSAFVIMNLGAYASILESSGQPKPLLLEWRNVLDAQVVGMDWDEAKQVVWLWIRVDGEPIAYSLPWPKDPKKMGELQDRWRRRGATGDEFYYNADGNIAKVVPPPPQPEKTQ